ncbi:MAG TPA: hypothetical protein VMU95_08070 [Trebonia sp.]|nr:hypothetical protein [Trebonia sp.]
MLLDRPRPRSVPCSTGASSPASGTRPPNDSVSRVKIAVAAATEICCPMTWKISAPNRPIAGSRRTQASGSKSGRASMTRASTGSAACSQANPVRISCARAVVTVQLGLSRP